MSYITEHVKNGFKRFLGKRLCSETKRLIVLSSLAACLENITDPTKAVAYKLNKILHLCHDDQAMIFPMYISRFIWGQQESLTIDIDELALHVDGLSDIRHHKFNEEQLKYVAGFLTRLVPSYLLYGNLRTIRNDIRLLIRQVTGVEDIGATTILA